MFLTVTTVRNSLLDSDTIHMYVHTHLYIYVKWKQQYPKQCLPWLHMVHTDIFILLFFIL